MAFLHARPTSTTKPICVKMLMSMPRQHHAGDRAEQAHRHDQDDRQRQRPALVLRRQHQEHEHHRQREDVHRRVAGLQLQVASARSTRSAIDCGSSSSAISLHQRRSPAPELTPGAALPLIGGGRVHVVAHDHHRAARCRGRPASVPSGTISPLVVAHLELLEVVDLRRGSCASAWTLTCQVRPKWLKSLT